MELAEVSSIPFESPFISSFNTLVEQVASQANKAHEVTFCIDLLQVKKYMCNFLYQELPSGWCKIIHLGRSALGVPLLEYLGEKNILIHHEST